MDVLFVHGIEEAEHLQDQPKIDALTVCQTMPEWCKQTFLNWHLRAMEALRMTIRPTFPRETRLAAMDCMPIFCEYIVIVECIICTQVKRGAFQQLKTM